MLLRWVVLVALAIGLGACASLTRGTTEQITIVSNPLGAEVRTTSGLFCVTPCSVPVGRKDEFVVTFTKEGYESLSVPVVTRVGGTGAVGFIGNVALGGVIGMGVDVVTGAALDHCPNPVAVVLKPIRRPPPPQSGRARVPYNPPVMDDYVQPDPAGHCKFVNDPDMNRNDAAR